VTGSFTPVQLGGFAHHKSSSVPPVLSPEMGQTALWSGAIAVSVGAAQGKSRNWESRKQKSEDKGGKAEKLKS
jgi:hypothetical protein